MIGGYFCLCQVTISGLVFAIGGYFWARLRYHWQASISLPMIAQRVPRGTLAPLHNSRRGRSGNEIRSPVIRSLPCDAPGIRRSGVGR
jgi:hypothetical protein